MKCFQRFYETWFEQLQYLVDQLKSARNPKKSDDELNKLVGKVLMHFREYYRMKSMAAQRDVFGVMAAPWASSLERSLHWISGWRPTTVFHLIYTESSILLESHILDILRGVRNGDLGDLSPSQFRRVSELQCEIVKEENELTEELLEWQDSVTEYVATTTTTTTTTTGGGGDVDVDVDDDNDNMVGRLVGMVQKADEIRLKTLVNVVELLTPNQAVEFFTAAAELLFGVRLWGLSHDRERYNL